MKLYRTDRDARRLSVETLEARRLLAAMVASAVTDSTPYWDDVATVGSASLDKTGIDILAVDYTLFQFDRADFASRLAESGVAASSAIANRSASAGSGAQIISVPRPDGSFEQFSIIATQIMAPELAAKFPDILTFRGSSLTDPTATLNLDLTPAGFHAQVFSSGGDYYVDPYYHLQDEVYASYFAAGDFVVPEYIELDIDDLVPLASEDGSSVTTASTGGVQSVSLGSLGSGSVIGVNAGRNSGAVLRTYRTAIAATAEYTAFHGGTIPLAQAAIVTAINRVSGIYERELSIRLQLVANNDNLIKVSTISQPYTNIDGAALLGQNQREIDRLIGSNNYDVGHVFSTGGGGVASLGSVGINGRKAMGVTGLPAPIGDAFYVDFVAHEFGHQFGANHTFNGVEDSCGGQRNGTTAYEPGSGSTILAYAGICGSDDLQTFSDPYFHSASIDEIVAHVDDVIPTVGVRTATLNNIPIVDAGPSYFIPIGTPFTVTATGTDNDGDQLFYNYEQRDLGLPQAVDDPDNGSSPLFRSFLPTTDPSRTFPQLSDILNNTQTIGEQLPTIERKLKLRATVRDGKGGYNSDDTTINIVNTGEAFAITAVTAPWEIGKFASVEWNVAGTRGNQINTQFVNIFMSTDSGRTFTTQLAAATENDGEFTFVVPEIFSSFVRVKVEAVDNIFFDISDGDISILTAVNGTDFGDAPDIYQTTSNADGARHQTGRLRLGRTVDFENDATPTINANGDGADEDGVEFLVPLVRGQNLDEDAPPVFQIAVTTPPGGGILNYFFDFNGFKGFETDLDEGFEEAFEQELFGGTTRIAVKVPLNAIGTTYARFRLSSGGGLGPAGAADDGEVEDYKVSIFATEPQFDFGDAPYTAQTNLGFNGARHILVNGGPRLGADVTGESNSNSNSTATSDSGDDGISFTETLLAGSVATFKVNSNGGVLNYFFDFNGNGVFGDNPNEVFVANLFGGTETLAVPIPVNARLGTTFARFRLSTIGLLGPTGSAFDGEVEDYQIVIANIPSPVLFTEGFDTIVTPNLPDGWETRSTNTDFWRTQPGDSDSGRNRVTVVAPRLQTNVSSYRSDSTLTSTAIPAGALRTVVQFQNRYDFESNASTNSFYDGGVLEISINGGEFIDVITAGGFFLANGYDGVIQTGNGNPIEGRAAFVGASSGYQTTILQVPTSAASGTFQLRWRLGTDIVGQDSGGTWDIDTIRVNAVGQFFDYGDAPLGYGSASHVIINDGALALGSDVSAEPSPKYTPFATGDNFDDGIVLPATFLVGGTQVITVTATQRGIFSGWIDINGDGIWDDGSEKVARDVLLQPGTNQITVRLPAGAATGATLARFRISTQAGLSAVGSAPDGEVEDYAINITTSANVVPTITSLKASSSQWTTEFLGVIDPTDGDFRDGSDGSGYEIQNAFNPNDTLPWTNLNQIIVSFSGDVVGSGLAGTANAFSIDDVEVAGVNKPDYKFAGAPGATLTSISYNPTTFEATLNFNGFITVDKILVEFPAGRVTDRDGVGLTPYSFQFNVVPGDVNNNTQVSFADLGPVRARLGQTTFDAFYDPRFDISGNGKIAIQDVLLLRPRFGTVQPFANPISNARPAARSSSVAGSANSPARTAAEIADSGFFAQPAEKLKASLDSVFVDSLVDSLYPS